MLENGIEQIEIDAIRALSGADSVKQKILAGMKIGYPSLEQAVYLTKCRVKDHSSLVKKVLDRRAKGKPNYKPSDVTDIIGLRLLTLYRKDIPTLVYRFLEFVKTGLGDDFSFFAGPDFKDACCEIIIYSSSRRNDKVDNLVVEKFKLLGLSIEHIDEDGDPNDSSADVKIVYKPSQYSSIHLILWCNGASKQPKFRIPMEVQIRTSLEDVWGEIEHGLRYKHDEQDSDSISDSNKEHFESASENLLILKGQLDLCSNTADSISKQISFASRRKDRQPIMVSAASINLGKLENLELGEENLRKINQHTAKIKDVFRAISGEKQSAQGDFPKYAAEFLSLADVLVDVLESYQESPSTNADTNREILYYLNMEIALCNYWAGRIYFTVPDCIEDDKIDADTEAERLFSNALRTYYDVESISGVNKDAILAYRIANVLSDLGEHEIALDKFREAVSLLDNYDQKNLKDGHYLRVRIPRQLGVALWNAADRIRLQGEKIGVSKFMLSRRRDLYKEAVQVTVPLVNFRHNIDQSDLDVEGSKDENSAKTKTINNILEYALCFLRAGGNMETLAEPTLSTEQLNNYAKHLTKGGIEEIPNPLWADTLRAAAKELLVDRNLEVAAANQVIKLIDEDPVVWRLRCGNFIVDEMLRDAQKSLDNAD